MVRILRLLCMPVCLILLALVVGMFLSRLPRRGKTKKRTIGRLLLLVGLLALYLLSIEPVANGLVRPLESRYPPPSADALKDVDLIIVLGGGAYRKSKIRPRAALGHASLARVIGAVRLLRNSNARYLLFTGYSSVEDAPAMAEVMSRTAIEMGLPDNVKIILEENAANTFEHPAWIEKIFPQAKQMKIAVVTSAIHMPRSIAAFEHYFDPAKIVPAPVTWYHISTPLSVSSFLPSAGALNMSTMACREYLGYLWYKIRPKPKV